MSGNEIVEVYASMVYKIAFNYARNSHDADDIFSESFLRYFKKDRTFESEEHRQAWLIRVTINCAKEFMKKRGNYGDFQSYENELHDDDDFTEKIDLERAIARLPADDRNLIFLFYYKDLSVKQIAYALEMNENTVKTRLSRARKKLEVALLVE